MAGDHSRFTYTPQKRYSAVLTQQGRVQVDADSNEEVELVKRRWEIQAIDTFGRCAVPTSAPGNSSAFQITNGNGPDFNIGVGRLYVDGLLAESFDEDKPISYLKQPFYPKPPDLLTLASTTQNVVAYLDVWNREVTYVQDRDLLEKALYGVDTAARIQTVWQVKVAPGGCRTRFGVQSTGQLTTQAVQPPADDDPCVLGSSGGYRGLENRLYRVEVHTPAPGGQLADLKFKWSRENASVVSSVEAIPGVQEVQVSRIGRDKVLRFKIGDWVEILDDYRELMGEPGAMARIVNIDESNRRITLDRQVPQDFDPQPQRHTRLIRWDQQQGVDADGLVSGSTNWIDLEDGVQVLFTSGAFQVADYWVFAARTADGSVEQLQQALPRGVKHHYCALSELVVASTGIVIGDDCRHLCAPCAGGGRGNQSESIAESCCVTVTPGQSIQAAVNSLPPTGGCVCLQAGDHLIGSVVQITRPNVVLHGQSLGARMLRINGPQLVEVTANNVTISTITLEVQNLAVPPSESPMIDLANCRNVAVRECHMVWSVPAGAGFETPVTGVRARGESSGDFIIVGNQFENCATGVAIEEGVDRAEVESNLVKRSRLAPGSIVAAPLNPVDLLKSSSPNPVDVGRIYGIDTAATSCAIRYNTVLLANPRHGGIRASGPNTRIEHNRIVGERLPQQNVLPLGILLAPVNTGGSFPDGSVIEGNTLTGDQDGIVVSGRFERDLQRVTVISNHLDGMRLAVALKNASGARVLDNILVNSVSGVSVSGAPGRTRINVCGNDIENMEGSGIAIGNVLEAIVTHNRLSQCGYTPQGISIAVPASLLLEASISIALIVVARSIARVESCEILNTGISGTNSNVTTHTAVGAAVAAPSSEFHNNRIAYSVAAVNLLKVHALAAFHRALLLIAFGENLPTKCASVIGNAFSGLGNPHLVEIDRLHASEGFEKIIFSNNQCDHISVSQPLQTGEERSATVSFLGRHLVVTSNQVKADVSAMPSMNFHNGASLRRIVLSGNITTGQLIEPGTLVPADLTSSNIIGIP